MYYREREEFMQRHKKGDSLNCNAAIIRSTLGAYRTGAFVERNS